MQDIVDSISIINRVTPESPDQFRPRVSPPSSSHVEIFELHLKFLDCPVKLHSSFNYLHLPTPGAYQLKVRMLLEVLGAPDSADLEAVTFKHFSNVPAGLKKPVRPVPRWDQVGLHSQGYYRYPRRFTELNRAAVPSRS